MTNEMTSIIVRFSRSGFHCWPQAPVHREYLSHSHRHLFYVEVEMPVLHDNREVEFHDLLNDAKRHFGLGPHGQQVDGFGPRSCEMLARELGWYLAKQYDRPVSVSVFEDNEVGARVQVEHKPKEL